MVKNGKKVPEGRIIPLDHIPIGQCITAVCGAEGKAENRTRDLFQITDAFRTMDSARPRMILNAPKLFRDVCSRGMRAFPHLFEDRDLASPHATSTSDQTMSKSGFQSDPSRLDSPFFFYTRIFYGRTHSYRPRSPPSPFKPAVSNPL
jgi:hypothetical protein